jgi:hypothetical protein
MAEPTFKSLVLGVVPQPRALPPTPFAQEDLQKLFVEVTRDYPYQQFGFLPTGGAQLVNAPDDIVMLQPGLLQVQIRIDPAFTVSPEAAREKGVTILRRAFSRLHIDGFLQCGIKVVAHLPTPEGYEDAVAFISQKLMGDVDPDSLAAGFFAGGVKFRRIDEARGEEANLLVEPFIRDRQYIFIDYDVGRAAIRGPFADLDQVANWVDEAFGLVSGPTMGLLEA